MLYIYIHLCAACCCYIVVATCYSTFSAYLLVDPLPNDSNDDDVDDDVANTTILSLVAFVVAAAVTDWQLMYSVAILIFPLLLQLLILH